MRNTSFETAAKSGFLEVQTSEVGTGWAQLPDESCNQLVLYNDTGVSLQVQFCDLEGDPRAGESYMTLKDGNALPLRGISNSLEVQIKREDDDNSQVICVFYFERVAQQ